MRYVIIVCPLHLGIGIKVQEGLIESVGCWAIDTVAFMWPVDSDDGGGTAFLDQHQLCRVFLCHVGEGVKGTKE